MTVRELLERIDSRELAEWIAFNAIEPVDNRFRGDLQAGIIASTLANCHRSRATHSFTPIDFMPMYDKEVPKQQTKEQMIHAMKRATGQS